MTTNELPYHRACGPLALAAIARRSEYVVADDLLRLQRSRGRVTVPGTMVEDMHTWLVRRGFKIEPWDLDRDEPGDAEEYAEQVRTEPSGPPAHGSIAESICATFPQFPRERVEAVVDEWMSEQPKLREWISAHPVGTFLVHVDGHYLAFRDGRVIAGDDAELRQYGDAAVLRVERISR